MSKRTDILETALALFNANGYIAVGVDRIRDDAGASKMTLYKHFPSKDVLIQEVLALRHEQLADAITRAVAAASKPEERLRCLFEWHRQWFKQPDFHGCMFIKALDEHPNHAAIIDAVRRHKQWLTQLIATLLTETDAADTEQWAAALCMQLDGAIVHAAMFDDPAAADRAWQMACRVLGCLKENG
ncbi:TetR/AcrR family transcriptional regulator [Zymobacter palmae]|uniref:Transcriptional regulator n=1 Tax=Zymobacter palmae TaxID=33074 RepID=A0A348HHH0_9GAMM|nr:TetR/AcrR family transcriptional regulator [Zymobacter palmae]BBG31072.1 transcriptional regulator [Zymobacter palmae]